MVELILTVGPPGCICPLVTVDSPPVPVSEAPMASVITRLGSNSR
ncbi:Uncharacterised protein [Mycobacteroides abscessus subsp. abscessus]|nr:Uncharacterised protein [Mycobacteroides abscessus subsp. abscessus]